MIIQIISNDNLNDHRNSSVFHTILWDNIMINFDFKWAKWGIVRKIKHAIQITLLNKNK